MNVPVKFLTAEVNVVLKIFLLLRHCRKFIIQCWTKGYTYLFYITIQNNKSNNTLNSHSHIHTDMNTLFTHTRVNRQTMTACTNKQTHIHICIHFKHSRVNIQVITQNTSGIKIQPCSLSVTCCSWALFSFNLSIWLANSVSASAQCQWILF